MALYNHNSLRIGLHWMESPDVIVMSNRQFREACRLMLELFKSTKKPRRKSMRTARLLGRVKAIWGAACVYCGVLDVPMQVEHITPVARGGTDDIRNLTVSCQPCNNRKRTRTAAEFGYPEIQEWADSRA